MKIIIIVGPRGARLQQTDGLHIPTLQPDESAVLVDAIAVQHAQHFHAVPGNTHHVSAPYYGASYVSYPGYHPSAGGHNYSGPWVG